MNNSPSLSELAGIIVGDGSINVYPKINHYRFKITLNSNEKEYAEYIQYIFRKIFKEDLVLKKRKNENTLDLFCFKRKTIRDLLRLGFVASPKKNRVKIPDKFINKKYGKHVLRGCFDTDGCVVITNNNGIKYPRLELKIMQSPLQRQIFRLLDIYGFNFKAYQIGGGEVRVQINGKHQSKKWAEEIGFSNNNKLLKLKRLKN